MQLRWPKCLTRDRTVIQHPLVDNAPENPYQAPAALQDATAVQPSLDFHFCKMKVYSRLALGFIALDIPYTFLVILLAAGVVRLPVETLELADQAHVVTTILGIVFYCMWKYRCARNAGSFYGGPLSYSPGWCVGYYFIPILMLFRPYQCMKDIYEKTYLILGRTPPNPVLLTWWLAWIFSGIIERGVLATRTPGALIVSHSVSLLATVLVIWVIHTLTRRQYEIVTDGELTAKIGTMNPFNRNLLPAARGIPMKRRQLPPLQEPATGTSAGTADGTNRDTTAGPAV